MLQNRVAVPASKLTCDSSCTDSSATFELPTTCPSCPPIFAKSHLTSPCLALPLSPSCTAASPAVHHTSVSRPRLLRRGVGGGDPAVHRRRGVHHGGGGQGQGRHALYHHHDLRPARRPKCGLYCTAIHSSACCRSAPRSCCCCCCCFSIPRPVPVLLEARYMLVFIL